ncbi:unnamed protein product, partial [Rotaria sp. Silwood1]
DFQLLLIRYDMIALEDLMVLLIVSKLAKPNEIKSYAKTIFRLNLLIMIDFNNHDMKFLRDLKLLSDIWYKRYLLSQTNETDRCVSEIIDEEQEQEDQNQHKFHSAIDEDFDLDAYNELFKTKELQ